VYSQIKQTRLEREREREREKKGHVDADEMCASRLNF
jgi:hypothetical protein